MTINEIAEAAGVSASTVSRVFGHYPGISENVKKRVLEAARKHGYHPRVPDKRKNVVVITPYNSVYPVQSCVDMLLMSLTQALPKRGFRVEILPVNNLERLESIQFCAAAAIGVEPSLFTDWDSRFPVPLVIVDRPPAKRQSEVYYVRSDEPQGMALAIDHLYSRGCRKIGCIIHGNPESGNALIRHNAIVKALKARGLPYSDRFIYYSGESSERYVELTGKLLQANADALFCPGGNAGIVLLYAFSLYGKKVPDDVSLIASEQTFFSCHAVPPQTTITQKYSLIGEAVADIAEARLDNRRFERETILEYELIVRESVR